METIKITEVECRGIKFRIGDWVEDPVYMLGNPQQIEEFIKFPNDKGYSVRFKSWPTYIAVDRLVKVDYVLVRENNNMYYVNVYEWENGPETTIHVSHIFHGKEKAIANILPPKIPHSGIGLGKPQTYINSKYIATIPVPISELYKMHGKIIKI